MISIPVVLVIIAFVCFLLAVIEVPVRINLTSLGLAFCVLAWLMSGK